MKSHNRSVVVQRKSKKAGPTVQEDSPLLFFKHVMKGVLIACPAAAFLLLTASLTAYFSPDPDAVIPFMSLVSSALTALISGYATVRIHRKSALLCGLSAGSLLMCGMILSSLFLRRCASGYSMPVSLLLHSAFILLSVLGAYAGLPKAGKKRR